MKSLAGPGIKLRLDRAHGGRFDDGYRPKRAFPWEDTEGSFFAGNSKLKLKTRLFAVASRGRQLNPVASAIALH